MACIQDGYGALLGDMLDKRFCNRYHQHLLLTLCGDPLWNFSSRKELICTFRDFVVAHKAMIQQRVLHRDLSPNNFVISRGISYFIDFDHVSIIKEGETFTVLFGTGTVPYISMCILKKMSKNADIVKKSKTTINAKKSNSNTNSITQLELVEHNSSDDLKSFFTFFFKFVSKYGGAHGTLTPTWDKTSMLWADAYKNLGATSGLLAIFLTKKGAMSEEDILMDRVSESSGTMPLRKKHRCSSPDLEAPAQQSSRPNHGVGGHAAQLQRVGETVAAPTRKGPQGNDLQISSSEENPMAPLQLQKGKKEKVMSGFTEPWSNGHKMAGLNVGQQDVGHKRESMECDSGCKKERWNTEDYWEFAPSSHELTHQWTDMLVSICTSEWMMQMMEWISTKIWIDLVLMMKLEEAYDVLKHHHAKNRWQKAPLPTYLLKGKGKEWARTFKLPGGASTVQVKQQMKGQDKPRGSLEARILSAHLLEMRLQAVLATPILESQEALDLAREVLDTVLWTYYEKKIKLKRCYFLEYSTQMCQLEIFKNFMAQALKDTCLKFYYSNSKKALKNTDEFHQKIPINAMLLVAAVLKGIISGFCETGTDKVPELTTEQCRAHFINLWKSIDTLLGIPECHKELEDMLEQWARIGMGDLNEYADGSASDAEDVNIIL
ncbi:hypothetical protein BDR07DRAFT_1373941 [Suillus spraguei]|nr:hypothetical protein BDR07DRAFT_1373941 [Suillus spraguei]